LNLLLRFYHSCNDLFNCCNDLSLGSFRFLDSLFLYNSLFNTSSRLFFLGRSRLNLAILLLFSNFCGFHLFRLIISLSKDTNAYFFLISRRLTRSDTLLLLLFLLLLPTA
jgi:hypothetical protein